MPEPLPDVFPDDALVLRGGAMNEPFVLLAAQEHADHHEGVHAISVRCRHDYDEAQLYEQLGYAPYMISTVGRIREAGYDVVPSERDFGDAHADLIFGSKEPTLQEIAVLKGVFTRKSKGPNDEH